MPRGFKGFGRRKPKKNPDFVSDKITPLRFSLYCCSKCKAVGQFDVGARPCACHKKHKFSATSVMVDGNPAWSFPSIREGRRFSQLAWKLQQNLISELELQPRYSMRVNEKLICDYFADFRYKESGALVVEDVKGKQTDVFRLKKKLLGALFPDVKLIMIR